MERMPDSFVDLVVTSPPYDNLRTYNGFTFDFEPVADELFRVVKKGGVVVWVVGDATVNGSETGTSFRQALYFKEIGFHLHDTMIYAKENYIPLTHNRYEQAFEYMFVFRKPVDRNDAFGPLIEYMRKSLVPYESEVVSRLTPFYGGESIARIRFKNFIGDLDFRPIPSRVFPALQDLLDKDRPTLRQWYGDLLAQMDRPTFNPLLRTNRTAGTSVNWGARSLADNAARRSRCETTVTKAESVRSNIWTYVIAADKVGDHPAVFPESLAIDHVQSWSDEGDIVYDPFMGSGTTAKAAHLLKRNWIGSETSAEYVELANKRLEPYLMQETLF